MNLAGKFLFGFCWLNRLFPRTAKCMTFVSTNRFLALKAYTSMPCVAQITSEFGICQGAWTFEALIIPSFLFPLSDRNHTNATWTECRSLAQRTLSHFDLRNPTFSFNSLQTLEAWVRLFPNPFCHTFWLFLIYSLILLGWNLCHFNDIFYIFTCLPIHFFYVNVFFHICLCTTHIPGTYRDQQLEEGHRRSWDWSYRWLRNAV